MPSQQKKFGTTAVFLTALSTILGAILFLRFGWAVGNTGFFGTLIIILIGHAVTLPTAMAIAEIATNERVEGGGAYYVISRAFGINVGAAIGLSLFLSQAISVAFYIVAFAEALDPAIHWLANTHGILIPDKRLITLPTLAVLAAIMLRWGAAIGMKVLYVVVIALFASLALFFAGSALPGAEASSLLAQLTRTAEKTEPFFYVFAVVFPAFTGVMAGVGLSGDLKNPRVAIPRGSLLATVVGMIIYILVAWKLAISAPPEALVSDQLIMARIAVWPPIIPIGLAAAALSSAIGSIMVAPRTLQALGNDRVFPSDRINEWVARGVASLGGEPVNASIISCLIAAVFITIGDVNFVAEIISMFFMITYGAVCLISFLEYFAADPSYRPTFRSRWYISLFGAIACIWLMFQMNPTFAALALTTLCILYLTVVRTRTERDGLSSIFQGVIFQISRKLQIFLQRQMHETNELGWRPSVVAISGSTFKRQGCFELLRWTADRYGFGTYIHFIEGFLSRESHEQARKAYERLVELVRHSRANVYADTLVSPSFTSAVCQVVQLPGLSGTENNTLLFEFSRFEPEGLKPIIDNLSLVSVVDMDVLILRTTERGFGFRREMHIWLTPTDYNSAAVTVLLAFIVGSHPDWQDGEIRVFVLAPEDKLEEQEERITEMITLGRIPIARKNIRVVEQPATRSRAAVISEVSRDADLTIVSISEFAIKRRGAQAFTEFDDLPGNLLFVRSNRELELVDEADLELAKEFQESDDSEPTGDRDAATEVRAGASSENRFS